MAEARARSAPIAIVSFVLTSCGRLGFGSQSPVDATIVDARLATGPFNPPTLIAPIAAPGRDDDPTVTADGLEIYWCSDRIGGAGPSDIWRSTRSVRTEAWGAPEPVTELNTAADDDNVGIAPDGLTLWFASDQGGNTDVWVTTRAARTDSWEAPSLVPELNSTDRDAGIEVSRSLLRMSLNRGTTGNSALWESSRATAASPWTIPVELTELNISSDEDSGFLITDTELWFDSTRAGGLGAADLYVATRPNPSAPFDTVVAVEGVNTASDDSDAWLSDDRSWLVFSSSRSGDSEIYEATR